MTLGTAIEDLPLRRDRRNASGAAELISRLSPESAEIAVCNWLHESERQFNLIRNLPDGWDSHGGPAPNQKIIDAAEELLRSLCEAASFPKPHINPTRLGGVQFHWESGSRYFEIDVVGEQAATYLFDDTSAGVEEEGEVFMYETIDHLIAYIHRVYEDR